jgi:hypothetical protein
VALLPLQIPADADGYPAIENFFGAAGALEFFYLKSHSQPPNHNEYLSAQHFIFGTMQQRSHTTLSSELGM